MTDHEQHESVLTTLDRKDALIRSQDALIEELEQRNAELEAENKGLRADEAIWNSACNNYRAANKTLQQQLARVEALPDEMRRVGETPSWKGQKRAWIAAADLLELTINPPEGEWEPVGEIFKDAAINPPE
jgi:chromosome segregation ATPase